MGSGGVHKSLGRCRLMISIRRNTGNVRDHRMRSSRSLGVALLAILARPLPGLANGGASDLDPKPNAFSDDIQATG